MYCVVWNEELEADAPLATDGKMTTCVLVSVVSFECDCGPRIRENNCRLNNIKMTLNIENLAVVVKMQDSN